MRTLMKMQMVDTAKANEVIAGGGMPQLMQEMMERLHPEAAYFTPEDGYRTAYIVFDLADPSDLPVITEVLFQQLNARVEFQPVMNREDLQSGLERLGMRMSMRA
jgi:hypothetical protein